jgi:hypothetical protein
MSEKLAFFQEQANIELLETTVEEEVVEEGKAPIKKYFISGPMIECDIKNRNGRIYPLPVMEKEIERFQKDRITSNRALGELGHPSTTEINLDRTSHLIKEFKFQKNVVLGKAALLDTPMGKIAKALVDEDVKLGVSSRGTGTLKESTVQPDFNLIAIDIVSDPSAPSAFVDGILESKMEWIIEDGILHEKEVEEIKQELDDTPIWTKEQADEAAMKAFRTFIEKVRENLSS